jgi:hypothetical protein
MFQGNSYNSFGMFLRNPLFPPKLVNKGGKEECMREAVRFG